MHTKILIMTLKNRTRFHDQITVILRYIKVCVCIRERSCAMPIRFLYIYIYIYTACGSAQLKITAPNEYSLFRGTKSSIVHAKQLANETGL